MRNCSNRCSKINIYTIRIYLSLLQLLLLFLYTCKKLKNKKKNKIYIFIIIEIVIVVVVLVVKVQQMLSVSKIMFLQYNMSVRDFSLTVLLLKLVPGGLYV